MNSDVFQDSYVFLPKMVWIASDITIGVIFNQFCVVMSKWIPDINSFTYKNKEKLTYRKQNTP